MNPRFRILIVLLALFMGVFLLAPQTYAAKPIAKISSFKGEAIIMSGTKIIKVTMIGQTLNEGDRIQTREGEAEVTFNDGAVLKIRHFSSTMINEIEEKSGWWFFKTKRLTRRITCFVGSLWFKSGASKRKHYIQSPTAVCGVRGSVLEFGYDLVNNYLNTIEGAVDVLGPVIEGFFKDLGKDPSTQSNVYSKISEAYEHPGNEVLRLEAIKETLVTLLENENLSVEQREALEKALEKVNKELTGEEPPPPPPPPDTTTTEEEAHQEEGSPSH